MTPNFCTSCGAKIGAGANFCIGCGRPIRIQQSPKTSPVRASADSLDPLEISTNPSRWAQLPSWWHDYPKGDVHRLMAAIETNLQRREPLGQSDTIGFVRQLAITGNPIAIPVLRKAVRHQRLS